MLSSESIYAIIPEPVIPPEKRAHHVSKFRKSSKEVVREGKQLHATFGPKASQRSDPKNFTKKYEKTAKLTFLPEPKKFERVKSSEKPRVPKHNETLSGSRPTTKDFVRSNKIEVMTMKPPNVETEDLNWTKKPGFGQKPDYLNQIKREIEEETKMIHQAVHPSGKSISNVNMRELSDEEKLELISGLKEQWDEVWGKYRSFKLGFDDSDLQKNTHEEYEKLLDNIEKHIERLSIPHVYVYDDK
eukprot:TRINITY_DN2218_c0_g1_i1.p1 TRINITY_DN2218_c0_g1~~TRINITY_DN2218_c0_g1_i1.p1  ORF type:complete len:253 (-),score=71.47 TRINITY_DN2218_c0_g1_i1:33-764(-)